MDCELLTSAAVSDVCSKLLQISAPVHHHRLKNNYIICLDSKAFQNIIRGIENNAEREAKLSPPLIPSPSRYENAS